MRLTVNTGTRSVQVVVKGNSPDMLRRAERAARRLLRASAEPEKPHLPFGFTVSADTQLALEAADDGDEE